MNPKLQRNIRDIERAKEKIAELQTLLPELEKQRTDLENTEIIKAVRSACVNPGDLEEFLDSYRQELKHQPKITAGAASAEAQSNGCAPGDTEVDADDGEGNDYDETEEPDDTN